MSLGAIALYLRFTHGMSVQRLPRGTRKKPVVFPLSVEEENRDRFKAIAAHNGLSASAMFDAIVQNLPLDERGRLTWLPASPLRDGELPIDAA